MSSKKNKVHPPFSDLIENKLTGLSPIQKIMKIAEERNIRKMGLDPEEVISFGGGWCNHRTPESLRQKYMEIVSDPEKFHSSGRYSSIKGNYELREQISRFEKKIFDIKNLSFKNILLGQSSTQLFYETLKVLCGHKDNVSFLDPTYANYSNAVKCALTDSKISFIPALDDTDWTYLKNPEDSLEKLKFLCEKEKTKVLVIPVPDNPTSQVPPDGFLKSCLEILSDNDGFLVLDHAYKELWFDEKPDCFSWSPVDKPNLITIHSNSKWLSSLGRRLGWIEADKDVISAFEKINESMLLSPDTLHSRTTAAFLRQSLEYNFLKEYIKEIRKLYEDTSKVMIKSIGRYLGWDLLVPQGGLYTCCPVPNDEDSVDFVEDLLKESGVLLIPGVGFGPSMSSALRLSYGPHCYSHDLIKEGIERIGEYMDG
ncbi:MAG: pyridoxal phosphate-dependent aminotransferase [Candidatus Thermoplasmatota archaeon]